MSDTSKRFPAIRPDERPDAPDGEVHEAQILPFPFLLTSAEERRRQRAAVRPLTRPGPERTARASEPSNEDLDRELEDAWKAADPERRTPVGLHLRTVALRLARLAGLAAAGTAAVMIVGYLASVVFYMTSSAWIAPAVVTATDPRVTSARAALIEQHDIRDRAAAELAAAEAAIADSATVDPARRAELTRALADRDRLTKQLERHAQLIATLERSPYLRAATHDATFAMVPYAALADVRTGTPVFACSLGFVFCDKVGSVKEIVAGEVAFDHPKRDTNVRGQLVELALRDPSAAWHAVLFVGDEPLGF